MMTAAQARKIANGRKFDHWGNGDPYCGRAWSHGLRGDESVPAGYQFIHIPTWGIHLVKETVGVIQKF